MSGTVIELIPFKVELVKFEELDWKSYERDTYYINSSPLYRLAHSFSVALKTKEYTDKMCEPFPFKKAFGEVYTEFASRFPGEWIVVGKIGEFYLAAQPKKIVKMIPVECCRFVGLL